MAMVEQEQEHRIRHETTTLNATANDFRRGHWLGVITALCCIAGAVFTAYIGAHWSVSVALVSLPITALVGKLFSRN